MKTAKPGVLALVLLAAAVSGRGATFNVHMSNFAFVPQEQTIDAGDTVTWVNQDSASHDTTSGIDGDASGLWHSPLLGRGGSFSFTFNVPAGRYDYYCTPHVGLGMKGAIIVNAVVVNTPPTASLQTPAEGASFAPGDAINIQASANDPDGVVARVDFAANGTAIGSATAAPYTASFNPTAPGSYAITAVAVDSQGDSSSPPTVNVTVVGVNPPTNTAPKVAITEPQNGARFAFGTPITIRANAFAGSGTIAQVQFFNGTVSAGVVTVAPYSLTVTNLPPGSYSFTAVALDNLGQKTTSDSITVQVTPIVPVEHTPPRVRITSSPRNFARFSLPQIALAGSASDDVGLDHVEFQVNTDAPQRASGTVTWTANVTLSPGNNIIRVRAVDLAGNRSDPATRYYTYIASGQLDLTIQGQGRITPNLAVPPLQLGRVYAVTAIPRSGYVFAGWSGAVQSAKPRISFLMEPDLQLVAMFVGNPFIPVAGSYRGTFQPAGDATPDNSGSVQFQLSELGAVTGKLKLGGRNWSFHTQFHPFGDLSSPAAEPAILKSQPVAIVRAGLPPVVLTLELDPRTHQIGGTVTDGSWTAQVRAQQ